MIQSYLIILSFLDKDGTFVNCLNKQDNQISQFDSLLDYYNFHGIQGSENLEDAGDVGKTARGI